MELREYYAIAIKWWWLLILCALLGGGAAFLVSSRIPPTYQASTLLLVGGSLETVNPTTGELATSEKLAQTYAELLKTRPLRDATMQALGLTEMPEMTVSLVRNTQLLRISVVDRYPRRAAAVADELARQLILQSPSDPQRNEQAYREFVRDQLHDLEVEIQTLSEAIMARQGAASDELVRLQAELNERRTSYAQLLDFQSNTSINFISVVEAAAVPTVPVGPKTMQNTALAAIVGLMLAGGAAFLIEYLDDSVKTADDIEHVIGLALLGSIARTSEEYDEYEIIALHHPKSTYAEGYRMLRTNLRYALPATADAHVFLFTSVAPQEGKTRVSANIAAVTAMAGIKTILVDSDLRRPRQHKVWKMPNEIGLSSFLVGEVNDLDVLLKPTEIEGLSIITSGPVPPNASELLNSTRMEELLKTLRQRCDVVILDSPPVFAVTDASILARMVSGTILVVQAGRTKLKACAIAAQALQRAGDNLIGAIMNDVNMQRGGYGYNPYYGGYYTYYNYEHSKDQTRAETEAQERMSQFTVQPTPHRIAANGQSAQTPPVAHPVSSPHSAE